MDVQAPVFLFDIDGVIVPEGELFFGDRLMKEYDLSSEVIGDFFRGEFIHCLRGRCDIRVELGKYLESWRWQAPVDELLDYWFSQEKATDDRLLRIVRHLREKSFKVYIASNQEANRANYLLIHAGLDEEFEDPFFSY